MWLYVWVYLKWEIQVPENMAVLTRKRSTARVPWVPWVPWAQPERQQVQLVKWHPCHQRPQPGDQVVPQQDQWDISCSPVGQSFTDQTKIPKYIYISFPPYQTWSENYGTPKKSLVHHQHHHHHLISSPLK